MDGPSPCIPLLTNTIDVPGLTTGENSWKNIQPLLRHTFLHLTTSVQALALDLSTQKDNSQKEKVRHQNEIDGKIHEFTAKELMPHYPF